MRIQVTTDQLRQHLIQAIGQDQRSEGHMSQVGAAIWPQHRPDIFTGANWELLDWPAITKLPEACQGAIYDAVADAKAKYSLHTTNFLGSSAAAL
ncbi:hypothetical protein [Acidovorax radicis]|jgi:hypothetical protein|uniref:hypothetical protein n=1 Tax=Acidovorax radicis TaxID=758826 RepID=UPI001CF922D6|nr:hypothetical protein [Acidovorax radicis]UCU97891.1 hypothetical protein KI609_15170 [Acidovorax radicis]